MTHPTARKPHRSLEGRLGEEVDTGILVEEIIRRLRALVEEADRIFDSIPPRLGNWQVPVWKANKCSLDQFVQDNEAEFLYGKEGK